MIGVAVCTAPPTTPEWRAERRHGIGASEIAALLGHNPHSSPLDVWMDKLGVAEPFEGNWATRRGLHLERFLIEEWLRGQPVGTRVATPATGLPSIVAHPGHPLARASLDGLATLPGGTEVVLEVKTANRRSVGAWSDGGLPEAYRAQVVWQLGVTGLDAAVVIADLAGALEVRHITADPPVFERMAGYAEVWWAAHVDAGDPPDPDPVRDLDKLTGMWCPDPDGVARVGYDLVDALTTAQAAYTRAKADLDYARARVQIAMRTATTATDPGGNVVATWNATRARESLDTAAIRANHPRITKKYTRVTPPGRRFTIKERP